MISKGAGLLTLDTIPTSIAETTFQDPQLCYKSQGIDPKSLDLLRLL